MHIPRGLKFKTFLPKRTQQHVSYFVHCFFSGPFTLFRIGLAYGPEKILHLCTFI